MEEVIYSNALPGDDAISAAVEKRLKQYGDQIVTRIREQLLEQGKLASGELYNSIQYEVVRDGDLMNLNILGLEYFKWVDQGRPPGKQPPMQNILSWITAKGIRPNTGSGIKARYIGLPRGDKSLAFLIARKIGLEGLKATNILSTTIEQVTDPLTLDLSDIITKEITAIIGNGLKDMIRQLNSDIINITVNYS